MPPEPSAAARVEADRPSVDPSTLGQFVALDGCPQFFQYEIDPDYERARRNEKAWAEAFRPLSPLLEKDGRRFEAATIEALREHAAEISDCRHLDTWEDTRHELGRVLDTVSRQPAGGPPVLLTQVRLGFEIESWPVVGDADIIAVWPTATGVRIRVIDIKAAHEEKTYHQIQIAAYTLLLRRHLDATEPTYEWVIEGGVIHRGFDVTGSEPGDFPRFDLGPRELDVRRLLADDGVFDQLWETAPADARYQLAPKCASCQYKEACYTDAVENQKTALLGLTRGEQATLADHGIHTIPDLAGLAYPPDQPRPYDYDELTPVHRDVYDAIVSEPGIGERLPEYIQRAQALLSHLDPESVYTPNTDRRVPWLVGTGNGNLPEDDPAFSDDHLRIERGGLVRAYIHVTWDHRRNRVVMLSGYVTASRSTAPPEEIVVIADDATDDPPAADRTESRVLTRFFAELFDAFRTVAAGMGRLETAPAHAYFYTNEDRAVLLDALHRHTTSPTVRAASDLFGLRAPIDQAFTSVVQPELHDRLALPVPNDGLLPVTDLVSPTEDFFPRTDWTYTRADGHEVDLREAFRAGLFDYHTPYTRTDAGLTLYPADDPDGYYPSRARRGARIPLEYVWAALDRLPDPDAPGGLDRYTWADQDHTTRITTEDLAALGTRLARCIAHVERSLTYRNAFLPKHRLHLDALDRYRLGPMALDTACREYLALEHRAMRRGILAHYRLPVVQRVRRGDSIPFVVTTADETDDGTLVVEGRLLYDRMFEDGERVARACRQKAGDGTTQGSWMVANEIDRQAKPIGSPRPRAIERGPGVTIDALDADDHYIRITAIPAYQHTDREFVRRHRGWTTDPTEEDEQTQCFEPGRVFVLDPRTDDLLAQRAHDLLDEPDNNPALQLLTSLATGRTTHPETHAFAGTDTTPFTDWLETASDHPPNPEQAAFITDDRARIALLQGPPGTGKTRGALAPAILARVAAFTQHDRPLAGIITAESNKAVDEVLAAVADLAAAYRSSDHPDLLSHLTLVRLTDEPPADPAPGVEYVNYHTDHDTIRALAARLRPDATPEHGPLDPTTPPDHHDGHVLVFATPARLYGLINKLDAGLDDPASPADWLRDDTSFFDLLAVDEASMMRLPSFILAGAFLHDHAQLLITGDHRQLPPVQHHDWEGEHRRTIRHHAPYLSTLDYFRVLAGDQEPLHHDAPGIAGTADLPFHQLERTYRCHTHLADLLNRHVYHADGIRFRSTLTRTIPPTDTGSPGVQATLEPGSPVVLVLHDDRQSQQANQVEAAVSAAVIASLTRTEAGIVTPHNAQRGLLTASLPAATEVDTVERYQGGERECILVSATASDPDFLTAERDFILNPNRLNVAMSRMQHKLVVIASEAVFDLVPPDVEKYERARLWKGLFHDSRVLDHDPAWSGTLEGFLPPDAPDLGAPGGTRIRVYPLGTSDPGA